MEVALEITFSAFYPRKQPSAARQKLCCQLLDCVTEVVLTSPLPLWRLLADGPLTPSLTWATRVGKESARSKIQKKMGWIQKDGRAAYLSFNAQSSVPLCAEGKTE